ncbi:hypothetical protein TCDM_13401 [Trypanosoma cruzi Dm28c]|uniref:Uncharacterized protein n=1 Tax=Trypanosoma cruzi Dm28c TaxID=1416333 RepID=V5AIS4_TRYCR|nr:hypothetical protein TCDM_13401 [Trypanosoma cruzi Dm28c]
MHRLGSIHFASAFMPADGRTLVALCADIRVRTAAMPTAVSVVATWAAEHSLIIDADGSVAALFCIASHGQSDDDTADHRLGGGKPRVKSHPVRLLGYAIVRHLNFVSHVTAAAGQFVLLCCRPRLGAGAGASRHTMRSLLVGCVHTALHHGGEATAPCPAPTHLHSLEVRHSDSCTASLGPRAANKDTSVHLAANPAPLRRIIGCRAPTPHERLTRLRYIEEKRGAVCLETAPSSIPGKTATSIPLPGDAVFKELRRFRGHMGSPLTTSAPLMLSTEFSPGTLRAAAGWASSGHGTPRPPWTVSDDRSLKRPATLWDRMTQAAGRTARCLSLSMHLDLLRCHFTPGQRSSLWGLTAQLLAALHAPAEWTVLSLSMASDNSRFHAWQQQHPNRPHEFLPPQTPLRRWRHSALACWRCTTNSPKRVAPCRIHWLIEGTQLASRFP